MNSKMIPVAVINPDAPLRASRPNSPHRQWRRDLRQRRLLQRRTNAARVGQSLDRELAYWGSAPIYLKWVTTYSACAVNRSSSPAPRTESKRSITCPHRGARLLTEGAVKKVFVCPSTAELQRRATLSRTRKPFSCDLHRPGLTPVACEAHAGLIFVSMLTARPAHRAIGLEGYLENYQIDQCGTPCAQEWGSNWKVGVEAFYESYHLHAGTRNPRSWAT